MDIDKLQKALAVMNHGGKSGNVFGYHDEIQIYPMADKFTPEQMDEIVALGFIPNEEDGFSCFT